MKNKQVTKLFLKKDWGIYILVLLELIISVLLIYNIQKEIKITSTISKLNNYYWNSDESYSVQLNPENIGDISEEFQRNIISFYNELKSIEFIESSGLIYSKRELIEELNINYIEDILVPYSVLGELTQENEFGKEVGEVPIRYVDYDYYKALNVGFVEGDGFKIEDNKENNIFAILGEKFKKYYNINDDINIDGENLNVIGIADESTPIPFDRSYSSAYPFLDDSIMVLINDVKLNEFYFIQEAALKGGINIRFTSGDIERKKQEVYNLAENYGFKIGFISNTEEYKDAMEDIKAEVNYSFLRSAIFLIVAMIGLISISVYSIYDLKREIGIIITLGAKTKDVIFVSSIKMIVIGISAFIVGTILDKYINLAGGGWYRVESDIINVIITMIVMIISMILTLVIPTIKIMKMKPRELVGGEK